MALISRKMRRGGGALSVPVTYTFSGLHGDAVDRTTYTFASVDIKTPAANRKILVAVYGGLGIETVSSVTVAGISASLIIPSRAAFGNNSTEMWLASVPSGASGDVVVTWANGRNRCSIAVWAIYGGDVDLAYAASNDSPLTEAIDVAANGAAFGFVADNNSSAHAWSGLDEDGEDTVETTTRYSAAGKLFSTTQTGLSTGVTFTGTPDSHCLSLASFRKATAGYTANAVRFDGTNDYLTRDADLTGVADGKQLLIALKLKMDAAADGVAQLVLANSVTLAGSDLSLRVVRGENNNLAVNCDNASAVRIVSLVTATGSVTASTGWISVLMSFDLTDTGKRHIYIGDTSALDTVLDYTNDTMNLTGADWSIGARPDGTGKLNADVADLMLWTTYLDLSVQKNRRMFHDSFGRPVNPTGAIATLGTPLIRLSGPTSTWHENKGSGGGFTENGELTTSTTSPSD